MPLKSYIKQKTKLSLMQQQNSHSEPQVRLGVHEMNLGNDYHSSPVPYWAYQKTLKRKKFS